VEGDASDTLGFDAARYEVFTIKSTGRIQLISSPKNTQF
jgi:hypothetical protein